MSTFYIKNNPNFQPPYYLIVLSLWYKQLNINNYEL